MNSPHFETLTLAALLHDLPALLGATPPELAHAQADPALATLLANAQKWATPEGEHPTTLAPTPLVSVFSLLTACDSREEKRLLPRAATRVFDYAPLASTAAQANYLFPTDAPTQSREKHLGVLRATFQQVAQSTTNARFDIRFNHWLAWLQRYAWCLPAHTNDVCLYDHLRLTAALSACLAQTGPGDETQPLFCLAIGDLSGIQDYIFDVAAVGAGGASKRLRARSFSIALVSDLAAHDLIHTFNLPLANVLMSSGGKFYALLPQLPETVEKLEAFRARLDAWLFDQYNGEIGLNLAYLPLTARQLRASKNDSAGFGAFIGELHRRLDIAKHRRSRAVLQNEAGWVSDKFTLGKKFRGQSDCVSCGKFAGARDGLCSQCAQQTRLGRQLTRADAVAFFRNSTESGDFSFLDTYTVRVLARKELENLAGEPYLVMPINDPDVSALTRHPVAFRYLANHVPSGADGAPLDFGEIASKSQTRESNGGFKGRELLGYIKADADHLGRLFAEGLRDLGDIASHDSAVHLIALSREMDLFFSGWLERTLSQEHAYFYTVFSGGDDLFVLGPWNQAAPLADKVNRQFRAFVCDNAAVTLSAGILYAKPGYPIRRAADDVEHELEQSKHKGRNRLTVLGDTFEWNNAEWIIQETNHLASYGDKVLRSSFLYRLVEYGQMYRQAQSADKAQAARFKSHFAYTLARNLRDDRSGLREWADGLLQSLFQAQPSRVMEHLGLIATTVLFGRRSSRRE